MPRHVSRREVVDGQGVGAAGAARADGPGWARRRSWQSATPRDGALAEQTNGSSSRIDAANVKAVPVLIGANDYGFTDIVPSRSPE